MRITTIDSSTSLTSPAVFRWYFSHVSVQTPPPSGGEVGRREMMSCQSLALPPVPSRWEGEWTVTQPHMGKHFWVKAEIASGRERGGSFYCDLVETDGNGKIIAQKNNTWSEVEGKAYFVGKTEEEYLKYLSSVHFTVPMSYSNWTKKTINTHSSPDRIRHTSGYCHEHRPLTMSYASDSFKRRINWGFKHQKSFL